MNRNRFVVTVVILILLISTAVVVWADQFTFIPRLKNPSGILKKILRPRIHKHSNGYQIPTFKPDPNVDYKILYMPIDESINYTILNAIPSKAPHGGVLKPRGKPFKLPGMKQQEFGNKPNDLKLQKAPSTNGNPEGN